MLIVISPAKKLDYEQAASIKKKTLPGYLDDSQLLIDNLRGYSAMDLAELMKLSMKLAELNFDRYHNWTQKITTKNAKQALLAFKGDVYAGMDADSFNQKDLDYAQSHLRILSGLYGLLRPLDLMMPYRLEMGTRLENLRGKNLYEFWGMKITEGLNKQLSKQGDDVLVNLASNEYFKSVKPANIKGRIITPQFREHKNDAYKIIGIYAKRARGLMSRFIIKNRIKDLNDIKDFTEEGYVFNPTMSVGDQWVFTRG